VSELEGQREGPVLADLGVGFLDRHRLMNLNNIIKVLHYSLCLQWKLQISLLEYIDTSSHHRNLTMTLISESPSAAQRILVKRFISLAEEKKANIANFLSS